jgi:thiosulfate reductase cytochrome b subunit
MQIHQHPLYIKICHWVNALAILLMVTSGWRIYNASPIFEFKFPKMLTIGGWLGGALQWHFAAMWLLAINGLIYLLVNIISGRMRSKFLPIRPKQLLADFRDALMLKLDHSNLQNYNAVQKSAYLSAMLFIIVTVLSGLAIWKSVQFPLLRELMGSYDNARIVHFFAMSLIVAFVFVHIVMVALVPETLVAMIGSFKRNKTVGAKS